MDYWKIRISQMISIAVNSLRISISIVLLLLSGYLYAQEKFIDKKGVVVFEASEKLFEEVKAKNESVTAIFDATNNMIASLALIRGFQFKNPLMQEHFNENYIESDLFPKAIFKGEILSLDIAQLGQNSKEYVIQGTLVIRGIEKKINPTVKIQKINNVISINGSFIALPSDFNIKIPKIVENKIAKQVLVKLDFKLKEKDEK